ncbi:hypothetical protein [Pseudoxanthomonas wuyuanensis]|uniref:Lipoprotein n=1 Tax=Pseudoxanthomonas wuyuanensis TaxID=1073196 RepID=A0A286DED4_9GAMM|nr:hypothetical protein [Pseudoxanthomonas wuyuanensis]KAF1720068.1 hypothetical protein CSC75_13080 [Pseudoxanthomonas wuyuanensis]SOD57004.1 hypothetical protein SAMN06296416_111117 [Pseudoxanthomonas wuyuanensis]
MDPFRTLTASIAVASLLTLSVACARTPDATSTPSEAAAETEQTTLVQLQERLLGFADSLRKPSDLSAAAFSSALGVSLTPIEPGSDFVQAREQPLAGGYSFFAQSTPDAGDFVFTEARFSLPGTKSPAQEPSPPCLWDAEEASQKLEAMGYKRGGQIDFQQGWLRQHWRPIGDGKQGISASLLIYRSGDGQASTECVYGIRFRGGNA